jgi:hypothetical protein
VANNEIDATKKGRQIDDNFDDHADAAVRCGVHRP